MAESGRTAPPRTYRHGHSRAPLSAARRTFDSFGQARLANLLRFDCAGTGARAAIRLRIHPTDREAILTMPPRGTIAEAREFAQLHGGWIAARLGRLPKAAPFQPGTVVPLRGVPHRIVHRSGERGTVWTETRDSGDKIICVAGGSNIIDRRVHDFLKREARRDLQKSAQDYAAGARRPGQAAVDPRPVEPLGFVHLGGLAVVLLAADPGAALRARLSRRP